VNEHVEEGEELAARTSLYSSRERQGTVLQMGNAQSSGDLLGFRQGVITVKLLSVCI